MSATDGALSGDGIVFAATGTKYNILARRAGLTVRRVMPGVALDLFTDAPEVHEGRPPWDRVHPLAAGRARPKFEALTRSRFERTLYLDCDVVMVAEVAPVFEVLRRFDIAGAHEQFGSAPIVTLGTAPLPAAFRQVNGGVLGLRRSPATDAFLADYVAEFDRQGARFDQPVLAELLWRGDLRLAVLPQEYNLMFLPHLRHAVPGKMMAPRLLHLPFLHKGDRHLAPADAPFELAALLNPAQLASLERLVAQDITLGAKPNLRHAAGNALRRAPWLDRKFRRVLDWFS